jgi:uncharacterized protein (DUF305 family)
MAVLLVVWAYIIGVIIGMDKNMGRPDMIRMEDTLMRKEWYKNDKKNTMKTAKMDHSTMDMSSMDNMDMSMNDMGKMLKGKTGAILNKAFLEGMIPHHQGAIEMAKYLTWSDKPELVKLSADIIGAQQKEIDQMNKWLVE